ncbi:Zinc finger domain containing protein [Trichostrongylus colubriformis]|uniref:Zinc finger domain containing protein n=1 Tax=Trichostrongylus colubriformis TaxID=6319 RepID=A0AAN8GBL4_TRICO
MLSDKDIKYENVEPEDLSSMDSKQQCVIRIQTKLDGEEKSQTTSGPFSDVTSPTVPLSTTANDNKGVFDELQDHQSSIKTTFGTLGLLSQTVPFVSAPGLFSYDNSSFLPQTISQMVPNQSLFSCNQPSFSDSCFTAANILNSTTAPILLKHFHTSTPTRKRVQAGNCHENSQCVNCKTTNTSLWRRNEHGEVECNACNLYYRKNKRPRPLSLCKETITKRKRRPVVDRETSS